MGKQLRLAVEEHADLRGDAGILITDRLGGEIVDRPVHFAEVLATLYRHLGIDPAEASLRDHTGRPQYLLDNPTPLPELS
jgi:hypothetical protein